MSAHHQLARKHTITAARATSRRSSEPGVRDVKPDAGRDVRRPSSRSLALTAALQALHTDAAVTGVSDTVTSAAHTTGWKNRKTSCVAAIDRRQRIVASVAPLRDAQALGETRRKCVIARRTRYCARQRWLTPLPRHPG